MARSHRIGQDKKVKVFRLVTRGSYEAELVQSANLKLGLERAMNAPGHAADNGGAAADGGEGVSSGGGAPTANINGPPRDRLTVERMLRCGAQDIALDDETAFRKFSEADIDSLLESSSSTSTMSAGGGGGSADGGSSSFAKVAFVADGEQIDMSDPDFWQKLLPVDQHAEMIQGEFVDAEEYGRGAQRKRSSATEGDWRYAPPDEDEESEARRASKRARKRERYEDRGSSGDEEALGSWMKAPKESKPPPRKRLTAPAGGSGELDEDTTDSKLWAGAHAEGWRMHDKGGAHCEQ